LCGLWFWDLGAIRFTAALLSMRNRGEMTAPTPLPATPRAPDSPPLRDLALVRELGHLWARLLVAEYARRRAEDQGGAEPSVVTPRGIDRAPEAPS
jgi:hypothetical protein